MLGRIVAVLTEPVMSVYKLSTIIYNDSIYNVILRLRGTLCNNLLFLFFLLHPALEWTGKAFCVFCHFVTQDAIDQYRTNFIRHNETCLR